MKKKCVLITGASRGIGRAIAVKFAQEGCHLVLNCVNSEEKLDVLSNELESAYGITCMKYIGNMGDYHTVSECFDKIEKCFGGVDVVINNAGISKIGLLSDLSSEEWDGIVQINMKSVFNCSKHALPHMVHKKSGKIINISSVWGSAGASCEVAYSTTKGGINAFTKALAKELAPSNIQVNAIACGAIDTEMNAFLSPSDLAELLETIPVGRLGRPEEVAELAWNLANGNEYLTGQIIALDGGWI